VVHGLKKWARESLIAVGAASILALVVIGSLIGYYSVRSDLSGVSVNNLRLSSIYALPNTYGIGMNVSFKVINSLTHELNLRSVTYVLSVDGVRVGDIRVGSLAIPPSSSKDVSIRVSVTDPKALEAINKSLLRGSMKLGVGVNYAVNVKLFNMLTFTNAMHATHITQVVSVGRFLKHEGGAVPLQASQNVGPHAIKVTRVTWLVSGKQVDKVVDGQVVTAVISATATEDVKKALKEAQSDYLEICVMHDYKVLSDTRTKCVKVPEDMKQGDSRVFTITFTAKDKFALRGYYVSVGYGSGGSGQTIGTGIYIPYWSMDNHYPPRLRITDPSFKASVQWFANGHEVNSVRAGTDTYAKVTIQAVNGLPKSSVKICVREDIAHGSDKDTKCVTYTIPDLTPQSSFTVGIRFKAEYHHHSYFFFSTYTRGYFVTMKFKGVYSGSSELSWEMSNHYPPRLRVKK